MVSCSSDPGKPTEVVADTPKIPDSVPQMVRLGKEANWSYKPDTAMNDLVLGDYKILRNFTHNNGAEGDANGNRKVMRYFNTIETEYLSVFTVNVHGKIYPYGFRLEKNSDSLRNEKLNHAYTYDRNFVTGHGIYIGMPMDYVQSIYKSQAMMKWTKGDTTYLGYAPLEKDKQYFTRYEYVDYSATYKFVDDQCRVIEMMVDPEVFEKQ